MFAILKIAGASAMVSAGLVSALGGGPSQAPVGGSAKLYVERAPTEPSSELRFVLVSAGQEDATPTSTVPGRGDRLAEATSCRDGGWPYVAAECLGEGGRRPVRTISIVQPNGPAGSTVTRVPASR